MAYVGSFAGDNYGMVFFMISGVVMVRCEQEIAVAYQLVAKLLAFLY